VSGTTADGVYRYPSADIPDLATLRTAVQASFVKAIVFDPGDIDVGDASLYVARRGDLLLCGRTGRAKDVVIHSDRLPAVELREARHVVLRGLTMTTSGRSQPALFLNALSSTGEQGYVDDVTVDRCALNGYTGVFATAGASHLTVTRCNVEVDADIGPGLFVGGGVGIWWGDGPGLFVSRTIIRTEFNDFDAIAGVLVRGGGTPGSDGDRVRGIFLKNNIIAGGFDRGFELDDVAEVRARGNRIRGAPSLSDGITPRTSVGIAVRRIAASNLPEDYEIISNRVRSADYGVWIVDSGSGILRSNDFRECGSKDVNQFGDNGGAVRLELLGGKCNTSVVKNDFRGLHSSSNSPAVVVLPDFSACFVAGAPSQAGNRVDAGRAVFGTAQ